MSEDTTIPPDVAAVLREASSNPWHSGTRGLDATPHGVWHLVGQHRWAEVEPTTLLAAVVYAVNHAQEWLDTMALYKAELTHAVDDCEPLRPLAERFGVGLGQRISRAIGPLVADYKRQAKIIRNAKTALAAIAGALSDEEAAWYGEESNRMTRMVTSVPVSLVMEARTALAKMDEVTS